MAITDKIISFWKQVRVKSSDMFTLFKVGIGIKVPTHKLHVKDTTDPVKIEGVQSDTSSSTKFLVLDGSDVIKHTTAGGKTTEEIQDIVGAMFTSNTETRIAATYEDSDGTIDLVVDTIPPDLTQSGTGTVHPDNITDLHGAGVSGSANQLLTDDGDGTVSSESELTYDGSSEILQVGSNSFNTTSIIRQAHVDGGGGKLDLEAGDGGGTNQDGGDVRIYGGKGTGSGTGGAIEFYVSTSMSSSAFPHSAQLIDMKITDGLLSVFGNIAVSGTVDGIDIAARDHDAVTLANTNYLSLSGQEITGGTVPVGSGGTGATTFTSGQILRGNGTSALTADTNLRFDGSNFVVASSTSAKPAVFISNSNSDAEAPSLIFDRTTTAGADGDDIGVIKFDSEDDAGNGPHTYAQILGEINDASDTAEEGKLSLFVASHDSELQPGVIIQSGNAEDEVDVFLGHTTSSFTQINGRLNVSAELDLSTSLKFSTTDGAPQNIFDAEDETIATIDAGGFTAFKAAGNLDIGAFDFRAKTFTSDVATGTAPFTVSSTTQVANLNAATAGSAAACTGNAATATNLVASTSTAVQLGTIELGHASDTTIARSAAGTATIEGKEIVTINKMRDVHTVAYHYSGTAGHYLTMSGATTSDSTFLSSASFHLMRVMPYDGKIIRITCFNQSSSSRNESFKLYIDGDDSPLTDNRGSELTFTSTQKGSADCPSDWTFSAGESVAIRRQPSVATQGTNISIVFEFDMTT